MKTESHPRPFLFSAAMRILIAVFFVAATAHANDLTITSMQSGSTTTPLHDRGLHGQGQVIAILDTGVDWQSCYFAEADRSPPPFNLGTPQGGLEWRKVDPSRRKIIAYNFLYSCSQYPGAFGCDDPSRAGAFDNHGHGTHAAGAAAGDKGTPLVHDYGDAIAPAAKLVVQDGGLINGDSCSHRPGFGCPVKLLPILDQAYKQGVRIHSNSWGDRQGVSSGPPPTANYPQSARDVDAFVWSHPDLLVVFNTGNSLTDGRPAPSTLSAPGSAKNTLQVGGTRGYQGNGDDVVAGYSLEGPTRDGRIKPDVVGPALVVAADAYAHRGIECDVTPQPGTSWASPSVAGAAALVRQYYTEGFYPGGERSAAGFTPSAALLKATIIAAARAVPARVYVARRTAAEPVPSYEQGFGFPVLDDALYFRGDVRRLLIRDVPLESGLAQGQSYTTSVMVRPGTEVKVVLVWTDPPGHVADVADTTPQLVNDLDLLVTPPAGAAIVGNTSLTNGEADRRNNVEAVTVASPLPGIYTVTVAAPRLLFGQRQGYALVITGDLADEPSRRRAVRR